jgi:pseudouridine-5'-phosphate glycosidase
MPELPNFYKLSKEVAEAQRRNKPLVALESTVITHGLPRPRNLNLARSLEAIVREEGAVPATIGVLDGRVLVGMEADELEKLAMLEFARKLSSRDLAAAVADKASGGTTVAATLRVAARSGILVFATGGIGGVHRGGHRDVSADLPELARQPMMVVCAGAKSILDLPATLEEFETLGIPVVGYQTDEFPAFYSTSSGLTTSARVESAALAAEFARTHWQLGGGGVLLAAPPPPEATVNFQEADGWVKEALLEVEAQGIQGQAVTPYLLKRISELSGGKSLNANLALLENNARVGAQVAKLMRPEVRQMGFAPRQV